jgi:hypothetical protein
LELVRRTVAPFLEERNGAPRLIGKGKLRTMKTFTVTYFDAGGEPNPIKTETVEAKDHKQTQVSNGLTVEFFDDDDKHVATYTLVHRVAS